MEHGTGAVRDPYDIRDYQFAARGGVDWDQGFDVEKALNFKLDVKDQGKSGSCGGQAWAYYGEVLEKAATNDYEPRSARWIYSHTFAPGGGSHGRDNCDHVIKKGWLQEKYATSLENGKPPSEAFMRIKPANVPEDTENARALSYLQVKANINLIAQAIQDNYGCVIGVQGQDNGTWRSLFPKAAVNWNRDDDWAHWVYCGGFKLIGGKKYIKVLNSWGAKTGENGWQWLGEEHFTTGNVWYGWTLAWDYRPAKIKVLMKEAIRLLKQLLAMKK